MTGSWLPDSQVSETLHGKRNIGRMAARNESGRKNRAPSKKETEPQEIAGTQGGPFNQMEKLSLLRLKS